MDNNLTTMKYEVGMIVRHKDGRFNRVLGSIGEVVFLSWSWDYYDVKVAEHSRLLGTTISLASLEEFAIVTPEEAGLPPEKKERWRPKHLEKYFSAAFDGEPVEMVWKSNQHDMALWKRGNVHRTGKDAIEWDKTRIIKD